MSASLQIEKIFVDAGKSLTANVVSQIIGTFDNTEKATPRLEVDFVSAGIANDRIIQRSSGSNSYYYSDYRGDWLFRVVTRHTDVANHANYVGQVRQLLVSNDAAVTANTSTYVEVKDVREAGSTVSKDPELDELATELVYSVWFALKPW